MSIPKCAKCNQDMECKNMYWRCRCGHTQKLSFDEKMAICDDMHKELDMIDQENKERMKRWNEKWLLLTQEAK